MGTTAAIGLVARREIRERVRDKSFVISIVVVVVVLGAFVGVPELLGFNDPDVYRVGAVGEEAEPLAEVLAGVSSSRARVELSRPDDLAAAEAALADDELDVVLSGAELVVDSELPADLGVLVQEASAVLRITDGFAEQGVDADEVARLIDPEPLPVRALDTSADSGRAQAAAGFAFFIVFVLYGQLLGFGLAVASGIVEEKQTRVVEILLSTLRPAQLLAGKVLGIGVVGLLQLSLTVAVGLGLVLLTGLAELPPGAGQAIAWSGAWFVLGYGFYACAFAVVGALVSRQEELQNASTPLSLTILGALFGSFAALDDPGSTLARVFSLLPPTAPMVMPVRLALGEAAAWEVAASVALMLVAIVGAILVAARVYSGGALQVARRVKLRQALSAG